MSSGDPDDVKFLRRFLEAWRAGNLGGNPGPTEEANLEFVKK